MLSVFKSASPYNAETEIIHEPIGNDKRGLFLPQRLELIQHVEVNYTNSVTQNRERAVIP